MKRSRSVKNGGTNPYFEEEDILLWLDQDNWVDNLKVSVLDEDAKEDKPIGVTEFSLLPYMKQRPEDAREDTFDLFYMMQTDPKDDTELKEVASGEIAMRVSNMCHVCYHLVCFVFSAVPLCHTFSDVATQIQPSTVTKNLFFKTFICRYASCPQDI